MATLTKVHALTVTWSELSEEDQAILVALLNNSCLNEFPAYKDRETRDARRSLFYHTVYVNDPYFNPETEEGGVWDAGYDVVVGADGARCLRASGHAQCSGGGGRLERTYAPSVTVEVELGVPTR